MEKNISCSVLDDWIARKLSQTEREEYPIYAQKRLDRDSLRRWQLARLQEVIQHAKNNSPYYRDVFQDKKLPPSLKAFSEYPFLSGDEFIKQGNRMLAVSQRNISRAVTLDTSGTMQNPKRIFFTLEDQELTIDFFHNGMKQLMCSADRVAVLLPFAAEGSVGDLLIRGLKRMDAVGIGIGVISDLEAAVKQIREERLNVLVGIPVQILALAEYCRIHKIQLSVKKVLTSTDALPKAIRNRLKNAGIEVFDHFGMTECGLGVALECPAHTGMHIRENDLYAEIINEYGDVIEDGSWGELVITTLTRKGMPFIRYRTGDRARILPEVCVCKSCIKRLEIEKRIGERTIYGLGIRDLDEWLFSFPEVIDYHPEVDERGNFYLTIDCFVMPEQKIMEQIKNYLKERGMRESEYRIFFRLIKKQLSPYKGKRKLLFDSCYYTGPHTLF